LTARVVAVAVVVVVVARAAAVVVEVPLEAAPIVTHRLAGCMSMTYHHII
jgi:hypothetical protein